MKRMIIALAFLAVIFGAYSCIRHDIKEAFESKEGNGIVAKIVDALHYDQTYEKVAVEFDEKVTNLVVTGNVKVIMNDTINEPLFYHKDYKQMEISREEDRLMVEFKSEDWSSCGFLVLPTNKNIDYLMLNGSSDFEGNLENDQVTVKLKGSCDFKGTITAKDAKVYASGSSDFEGTIDAVKALLNASGSCDIDVDGRAEKLDINLLGSSDIEAKQMEAQKLDINMNGSNEVEITCHGNVSGTLAGSSELTLHGNPTIGNLRTKGAAKYTNE